MKPNLPALRRVVKLLQAPLPKGVKFSMWTWKNECGTAACACGLAASAPWFIKRGFKLRSRSMCHDFNIVYKRKQNMNAAQAFFGIRYEDALHLFSAGGYPAAKPVTRAAVVRRIEDFIAKQA